MFTEYKLAQALTLGDKVAHLGTVCDISADYTQTPTVYVKVHEGRIVTYRWDELVECECK